MGKLFITSIILPRYRDVLIKLFWLSLKQTWRKVVENVHCPSPQPEDHARNEDPSFREDPDTFIEFDDGVFYEATIDGSEVDIMADYPDLFPFSKVSTRKSSSKKEPPTCVSPITLNRAS